VSVAAVLLATALDDAGAPAALLPWDAGRTLVEFQVEVLESCGVDAIEVVLGPDAERIIPLLSGEDVEPVVNPRWREGVAGSLRVGASAVPRDTPVAIIAAVEEPRPASLYRALLDAHAGAHAGLTLPVHDGRRGRPLVAGYDALAYVRNLTDGRGIDAVVERFASQVTELAWPDDDVLLSVRNAAGCAAARAAIESP
jgi:molybdenum cofactor cytidylyltransferase